eukprot:657222-Pleurochrysis_carterae.AAC.2
MCRAAATGNGLTRSRTSEPGADAWTPGPGEYDLRDAPSRKETRPRAKGSCFGSISSPRFPSAYSDTPSPVEYSPT